MPGREKKLAKATQGPVRRLLSRSSGDQGPGMFSHMSSELFMKLWVLIRLLRDLTQVCVHLRVEYLTDSWNHVPHSGFSG